MRAVRLVMGVGAMMTALAAPACGSDSGTDSNGSSGANTTTDGRDGAVAIDGASASTGEAATEQRIIPVNGDLAEVVWALGLGDQVVATDISATYPPAADQTEKIGYQRALLAETVLSFEPSIVLADDLAGPPEVLDQLLTAGVDVAMIERAATLEGPARKIRQVAGALGVPERGERLAKKVQDEIDAAVESAASLTTRPRVMALYLRGQDVQLVFGDESGIDAVIEGAGGVDVGTELGIHDNEPLSAEAILEAAPDAIVVTDSGLESVGGMDGLLELDGLGRTPAAKNGHVYAFEDQYLYGLGPRTGALVADLVSRFREVR